MLLPGGERKVTLTVRPEDGEKIIACSVETGRVQDEENAVTRVTAVRLYTNRGPDLEGHAKDWTPPPADGKGIRSGRAFVDLKMTHFDPILTNGHIKAGSIWGNKEDTASAVGEPEDVDPSTIVTEPQSFYLSCRERFGWQEYAAGRIANLEHRFEKPLPIVPTVLYGFRAIQARAGNAPRVALSLSSLSETGFTLSLKSFLHETSNIEANVLVLPNGKTPSQHGFVDVSVHPSGRSPRQKATTKVNFEKPFKKPPKICAWFTELSIPNGHRSIWVWIDNITADKMTIHIDTWAD
ncbi:unnamed protein product [Clonostachys byssicola]|uniref:H-type lectin domain-containing protein n=1 Tax=Clonostachys byssicola TaxID=160290 RepID=A0A9N9UVP4_9HYPO|nr:unnamed protein product [Clonostachys byssicola]